MRILKSRSGLTILFKQVPGRLVSFQYFVKCGSINERPEEEGYAHALEHMLFAGTPERTWKDIITDYQLCGAEYNAETGHNYTTYYATCPIESFEEAFSLTADFFYNATLPKDRWEEVEKHAVLNEILMDLDDPMASFFREAQDHAFGPGFHDPVGSEKIIRKTRVEDLQTMYDNYYQGKNIFLVIVGDVSQRKVLSVINKHDWWCVQKAPTPFIPQLTFNTAPFQKNLPGLNQTNLLIAKTLPKIKNDRHFFQNKLLINILKDYLHYELRELRGLCYSVHTDVFHNLPDYDVLYIHTSGEPEDAKELLRVAKNTIKSLPQEGLDHLSLEQARMGSLREMLQIEGSSSETCRLLGHHWLSGKRSDPFEVIYKTLETTRVSELQKLATRQFNGKTKISLLSPKGKRK